LQAENNGLLDDSYCFPFLLVLSTLSIDIMKVLLGASLLIRDYFATANGIIVK